MSEINIQKYLDLLYTSTYIPMCIVKDDSIVKICSSMENAGLLFADLIGLIKEIKEFPATYNKSNTGDFGFLKYKDYYIILGAFNESSESVDGPKVKFPAYPYHKFINILLLAEYTLNGNEVSFTKLYNIRKNEMESVRKAETVILNNTEKKFYNTYYLEQMTLTYIKDGNPEGMDAFLKEYIKFLPENYWENLDIDLRASKNNSVGFFHEIIKFGAIESGLDIKKAYTLLDIYVQKNEKCRTIDEVLQLRYDILLDLAKRVKEEVKKVNYSIDVDYAIQFIKNNTNKNIGVMDVVNNVNKSRSYLLKKFKEETGCSVGEYIMKTRLKDACMTLKYSNYTIAQISCQFNFSSQSYFQNRFKKEYGITPKEYRKR